MHRKTVFATGLLILSSYAAACSSDSGDSNTGGTSGTTGGASATGGVSGTTGGVSSTTGGSGGGMCKPEPSTPASGTNAEACKAFCAAEESCNAGTSLADCLDYRSCDEQDAGSATCVAALKSFWNCMRAQTSAICAADDCCTAQSDDAFAKCI